MDAAASTCLEEGEPEVALDAGRGALGGGGCAVDAVGCDHACKQRWGGGRWAPRQRGKLNQWTALQAAGVAQLACIRCPPPLIQPEQAARTSI